MMPIFIRYRMALLILAEGLFIAAMALFPADRMLWVLENAATFVALGVLLELSRHVRFGVAAYVQIGLFLALHTYGAHHSYGAVPVPWLNDLLGAAGRNNYDRLVHLASGLLLLLPARELLTKGAGVPRRWAGLLGAAVIVTGGALYECLEALAAALVDPRLADDFLAMQGDVWDSQKDLAMAMLGCALTLAGDALYERTGSSVSQEQKAA